MSDNVPWKGQHGAKRLVKEFRYITEQIDRGALPQLSFLKMHQVLRWCVVVEMTDKPR